MRLILILVFIVAAILVIRMMFSAQLENDPPPKKKEDDRPRKKRRHHKPKSTQSEKPTESKPWTKPKLEDWQPGQPVQGCPNLRNEFHTCSAYCWQRYAQRPPDMVAMDK